MALPERNAMIRRLKALSTEALADLVQQHDTSKWRREVFDLAEQLLAERLPRPAVEEIKRRLGQPPTLRSASGAPARPNVHVSSTRPPASPELPPSVPAEHSPIPESAYECPIAFEEARPGVVAVYCSDGRFAEQFDEFLATSLHLPRCDRLVAPGGPAMLAGRLASFWESSGVENQVRFLVEVHRPRRIVLIAHESCAYYLDRLHIAPELVDSAQHDDVQKAAAALRRLVPDLEIEAYVARRRGPSVYFEALTL
jgi:hypothetical protein